ncbi:hypothetical protein ABZW11_04905 [Nonomuraea sp. NPDC004580]|uniref:hypothetical protein n=1 Tax=Nonomuraea sp. NPDC004580 TaxID=3154552 RepID=UPI0033A3D1B7
MKSDAGAMADRLGLTTGAVRKALASSSGKASGGPAGGWTMVGERGAELVRLPYGSQVTSANQTAAMAAGGGGPVHVVLEVKGGSGGSMEAMFVQMIRRFVRVNGGDVQVVLGGR